MIKIFIAEEVPSGNRGEAAILSGIYELFKKKGWDTQISILSPFYPDVDESYYKEKYGVVDGVSSFNIPYGLTERDYSTKIWASIYVFIQHTIFAILYKIFKKNALRIMKARIWYTYLESDLILVGHDNLFANPFGSALLFLNSYCVLFSKLINKKCYIIGASVGPFKSNIFNSFIKFIFSISDGVSIRDKISYDFITKIDKNSKAILSVDPAVMMSPANDDRIAEIFHENNLKLLKDISYIGFMTSPIMYKKWCLVNKNLKYGDYIAMLSNALDAVVGPGVEVIIMYHAIFPSVNDDRKIGMDVYTKMKNKKYAHLLIKEYTSEELKGIIGRCRIFVGERTHSLIASASINTPYLAISHMNNNKTNGLLGDLYDSKENIIYVENLNELLLKEKISTLFKNAEYYKIHLLEKNIEIHKMAMDCLKPIL